MNPSLRNNIWASYASQIYGIVVGIAMLPMYIRYMGAEAYGLVGFFTVLSLWFQLLDAGLTPTMARETARSQGGQAVAGDLRALLRSLEWIFAGVATLGALLLMIGADPIAQHWLKVGKLPRSEVVRSIMLMAPLIGVRWVGELYRGVITGYERMVWLGSLNAATATARFVLVVPFLAWAGGSPVVFFCYQLCVAVVEAMLLMRKAYSLLPSAESNATRGSWKPLHGVMGFSLTMALANAVWICLAQTDKLLLSGLLSLVEYGWFTVAVTAAGGVLLLTAPIVSVLLPRLTALHALGDEASLRSMYGRATQWMGLLVWPASAVLACHAERVLWIWTNDSQLSSRAEPLLCLYALGNAAMAFGAFPYYLQFAVGRLRLHLLSTLLFMLFLLPSLIWAIGAYGALGAAWTWLVVNTGYFLFWTPVAHVRYLPGAHAKWLLRDILPIATLAFAAALASRWLAWPQGRLLAGVQLLAVAAVVLAVGSLGSSWLRGMLLRWRRPWPALRQN